MTMIPARKSLLFNRKTEWIALFVIAFIAVAFVIVPVWIIQPFKPQTPRGVQLSYTLRLWSPLVTILSLASGLFLVVSLWQGSRRWWKKAILAVVLVPLLASAWFARQNHFEWMFNPLANAAYIKADQAAFVSENDIVMAIESNGEAASYPIRQMAYHHLVQDTVGGTPIVATY